jgi:drug/metabolite transporter (DMT)-like permease
MNKLNIYGIIFAVMAAFLNGSVGVLSLFIFEQGYSPYLVAFYKCVFASFLLLLLIVISGKIKDLFAVFNNFFAIAFCAFLGFFMLFFFETIAYSKINVANVVFILFSSSVITTFFASAIIEKRYFNKLEIASLLLALIGLFLFSNFWKLTFDLGLIYASLAGIGYGLFMIYSPKLKIKPKLEYLTALMLFASIYLSIPFIYQHGFILPPLESIPFIALLAILPTIGGFFCTIKALNYITSKRVIVIEISELIFASMLAFIFFSQKLSFFEVLGGIFIILSILLSTQVSNFKKA